MLNSLIKYEHNYNFTKGKKRIKTKIDKVITLGKNIDLNNKSFFFKLQDKTSVKKFLKLYQKDMRIEKVVIQEF